MQNTPLISIGNLFHQTWEHYTTHLKTFLTYSFYAVIVLGTISLVSYVIPGDFLLNFSWLAPFVSLFLSLVMMILNSLIASNTLYLTEKKPDQPASLFPLTGKTYAKIFGIRAIYSLFFWVLFLAILTTVLFTIISTLESNAILGFSVFLFILFLSLPLVLYLATVFQFSYIFPVTNGSFLTSFKTSWAKTRSFVFPVFFRLLLTRTIFWGLLFIGSLIIQSSLLLIPETASITIFTTTNIIASLLTAFLSTAIVPLLTISDYFIQDSLPETQN